MASNPFRKALHPFRTFQRNQKGCMALTTLLAIISFLFLGVIIQLFSGRGGAGSQIETVAECRSFGNITSYELEQLRKEQDILQRFFRVLYENLFIADPNDTERESTLRTLRMVGQREFELAQQPEQIIDNWLVSRYVRKEGFSPNWDDAKNLLIGLSGGYLTDSIFNGTLQDVGISHQTVQQILIQYIQREQARQRFSVANQAITPATRWSWYQRLHRKVTIEAAAIPLDSLIDHVGNPSEEQLTALFEEGKSKKFDPNSPESGFVMPTEIAFQYIVFEPNQQLIDSITEEEMLAYYETNKGAMFRKPTTPPSGLPQLPGSSGFRTLPFPTQGLPMFPGTDSPSLMEAPADTPAEADAAGEESAPESEPEEVMETDEPAETEESAPESIEDNSDAASVSRVTTRLVVYQVDEKQTEEEQADEGQVEEERAEAVEQTDATKEETVDESEPIDLSILYRPFDEVKEEIRQTLAREKTMLALPIIRERMQEYTVVYHENFEQGKPVPPMPNLNGFVAEQGLELKTIPLGNVYTALKTELARGIQERQELVRMFASPPVNFEGATFLKSDGLTVLYWLTDQKEELRPETLAEVQETVLNRWKEIEARSLVQKKAESLASEAKAAGKPLAEIFVGRNDVPVVETEPFSWLSYGSVPVFLAAMQGISPSIDEVREKGVRLGNSEVDNKWIVAPGSEFMEAVYALQSNDVAMVFNQPQTAAYIVRLTSSMPSDEALWEQFQETSEMEYIFAGGQEFAAAREAWLEGIQKESGFRWVNKPATPEGLFGGY